MILFQWDEGNEIVPKTKSIKWTKEKNALIFLSDVAGLSL